VSAFRAEVKIIESKKRISKRSRVLNLNAVALIHLDAALASGRSGAILAQEGIDSMIDCIGIHSAPPPKMSALESLRLFLSEYKPIR
jgi:hypothetical protein